MEIIQSTECFRTTDGKFKFDHVEAIIRNGSDYYLAKWNDQRNPPTDLSALHLDQVQLLDTTRGPPIQPSWTIFSPPQLHEEEYYLNPPPLSDYASLPGELEERMSREIEACEILRQHPHPNIAVYYGCQETNGRVTGLYFQKYRKTLREMVNPGSWNKQHFVEGGREFVTKEIVEGLDGLRKGVRHLHGLGLVHNDVCPGSVMVDGEGRMVLIDFDSCRRVGEGIRETGVKRTAGWHEMGVEVSVEGNDIDALEEIKT